VQLLDRVVHNASEEYLGARVDHLATVIVVHHSGRLYPEAIIFTTTAAEEGEK
jgi:hypothetical protein